jgi:tripartite-type tricarboxylate transporter receptor subunit TctC
LLGPQVAGRPFIAPPDLPAPIVTALRNAFNDTMKDPDLIAMAQKMDLELSPVTGDAIEKLVAELNRTPRDAIELAKEIVK